MAMSPSSVDASRSEKASKREKEELDDDNKRELKRASLSPALALLDHSKCMESGKCNHYCCEKWCQVGAGSSLNHHKSCACPGCAPLRQSAAPPPKSPQPKEGAHEEPKVKATKKNPCKAEGCKKERRKKNRCPFGYCGLHCGKNAKCESNKDKCKDCEDLCASKGCNEEKRGKNACRNGYCRKHCNKDGKSKLIGHEESCKDCTEKGSRKNKEKP